MLGGTGLVKMFKRRMLLQHRNEQWNMCPGTAMHH
jgi:hypothetical protein